MTNEEILLERINGYRAEIERLREAIKRYVTMVDNFPRDYELDTKMHGLAVCLNNRSGELLRAALKGESK